MTGLRLRILGLSLIVLCGFDGRAALAQPGHAASPAGPGTTMPSAGPANAGGPLPPGLPGGSADAPLGRPLSPSDQALARSYLNSGLPATQFAPPRKLIEGIDGLLPDQKRAIAGQVRALDRFPAEVVEAAGALSVGNLAAFGADARKSFDWDRLDVAARYAAYNAMKRRKPLSEIRFLTPEQLGEAVLKERERLSTRYPDGTRIDVFPIAVGGDPVVEVTPPAPPAAAVVPPTALDRWPGRRGTMMVGGEPAGSPGDGALPVQDPDGSPAVNAFAAAAPALGLAGAEADRNPAQSGEDATCGDIDDRPCFMSTVALHDRFRLTCSGVLIAPDKVLTAAHCACSQVPSFATIGDSVPVGFNPPPGQRLTMPVSSSVEFLDPGFCRAFRQAPGSAGSYTGGDLAVLTLAGRVAPDRRSPFAVIADPARLALLSRVEVAGFGARGDDPLGGEKYFASLPVASAQCDGVVAGEASAASVYGCHAGHELVAIDAADRLVDSCSGDSGAGALARLRDGSFALVAIVSRGLNQACGDGGIYTLVSTERVKAWLASAAPEVSYEGGTVALAEPRKQTIN